MSSRDTVEALQTAARSELSTVFHADVRLRDPQRTGGGGKAWEVTPETRPRVWIADLVRALGRLFDVFVGLRREGSKDIVAQRQEHRRRGRAVTQWLSRTSGQAVRHVPGELGSMVDPVGQPLKAGWELAEWIVEGRIRRDACIYCQQQFYLSDHQHEQWEEVDAGIVHTYCEALLREGSIPCCPLVGSSGTGRSLALGKGCIIPSCRGRRSAEKIGELIVQLFLPIQILPIATRTRKQVAQEAVRYIATLGKSGLFDPIDIALDITDFGFPALVLDTGRVELANGAVLGAYEDEGYGISSLTVAEALHELILEVRYEPKFLGRGFNMREIQERIARLAAN